MSESVVVQMPTAAERKWEKADAAFNRGRDDYIEFAQELAKLHTDGTTQRDIGARYEMEQSSVSRAISIGRDSRIMANRHNSLPRSIKTLWLLTTLDDAGFAELAKKDTTETQVKAFIARHQPTAPPQQSTPADEPRKAGRPKGRKPPPPVNVAAIEAPRKEYKPRARYPGYVRRLNDARLIDATTSSPARCDRKEELLEKAGLKTMPNPRDMTPEEDRSLAAATAAMIVEHGVATVDEVIEQERQRAALSVPMAERFAAAVERARAAIRADMQRQFTEQFMPAVLAEVERRLPEEIKQAREFAREQAQRGQRMVDEFKARRDAIPQAMTRDDWRLILNCLHPDRAPSERRERFAEAFAVVRKLEPYFEARGTA